MTDYSDWPSDATELIVDPERIGKPSTGIKVRAQYLSDWGNFDIADLYAESLLRWLRSRGGKNVWAENCVGQLLGHGQIADD